MCRIISPSSGEATSKEEEWRIFQFNRTIVNDRKPYISFLFLQVACNCERDIRATTCGNLRRQQTQKRVCICFTNGLSTMRARRAAINANVRLMWFYSTIKWFFSLRTTPQNNELYFASLLGEQRRRASVLTTLIIPPLRRLTNSLKKHDSRWFTRSTFHWATLFSIIRIISFNISTIFSIFQILK